MKDRCPPRQYILLLARRCSIHIPILWPWPVYLYYFRSIHTSILVYVSATPPPVAIFCSICSIQTHRSSANIAFAMRLQFNLILSVFERRINNGCTHYTHTHMARERMRKKLTNKINTIAEDEKCSNPLPTHSFLRLLRSQWSTSKITIKFMCIICMEYGSTLVYVWLYCANEAMHINIIARVYLHCTANNIIMYGYGRDEDDTLGCTAHEIFLSATHPIYGRSCRAFDIIFSHTIHDCFNGGQYVWVSFMFCKLSTFEMWNGRKRL